MNYLTLDNVTKSYGERVLFENLTLHISQGDKTALVARNGAGKSSLMNLITNKESPDSGTVFLHKAVRTAFLEQEPELVASMTVFENVYLSENPVMKAIAAYEKAMLHPGDDEALHRSLADMDRHNAWDYEARVKTILAKLKIDDLEQPVHSLSGGQKKRVALAKMLIDEPDFLILDEPTNHLDLEMIEWLEEYLSRSGLTVFMVTHDRYFLEAVCDRIVELDGGEIHKYDGSYSYYLQKKAEREEGLVSSTERARNLYVRELDWMRRQPKARGTKAKARIDAFFEVEKKANRRLEEDKMEIEIQMNRLGSKVIEIHNVSKAYGDRVLLKNFDYKFLHTDRVGIVGNNGVGKSTLLNMINGTEKPDTGKVVVGDTVVLGYYTQSNPNFKEGKRVHEIIKDIAEYIPLKGGKKLYSFQLLERFLFDAKKQQDYVSKLSGGERRRLHLLTILMRNPNVLILDEPTNDLDVVTLQVLEEFLETFTGCLIIVSHDRHFMDKLIDHTFIFEGNGVVRDFPGNYSTWREAKAQELAQARSVAKTTAPSAKPAAASAGKGLSQEEQKEMKRLEKEMAKIEARKAELSELFNDPTLSKDKMESYSREWSNLLQTLEEKEMRWLELSEGGM